MTKNRAVVELIFAGALWGFGFIATIWALRAFTPIETLTLRYLIAVIASEIVWSFRERRWQRPHRSQIKIGLISGLLLASFLIPQTVGLLSTSATKSGFITTLYILIVPLLAPFVKETKWSLASVFFAGLALLGTYLLTGASFETINTGDWLTLLCAFLAAVHILFIDRYSLRMTDSFRFNTLQSFFCLVLLLALLPFQAKFSPWTWNLEAWLGILWLGLGSSMIAFTIQIRSQKVLHPTTASMLFLLESPFALVFAMFFLGETLTLMQAVGAGFILLASLLCVRFEPPASSPT